MRSSYVKSIRIAFRLPALGSASTVEAIKIIAVRLAEMGEA